MKYVANKNLKVDGKNIAKGEELDKAMGERLAKDGHADKVGAGSQKPEAEDKKGE